MSSPESSTPQPNPGKLFQELRSLYPDRQECWCLRQWIHQKLKQPDYRHDHEDDEWERLDRLLGFHQQRLSDAIREREQITKCCPWPIRQEEFAKEWSDAGMRLRLQFFLDAQHRWVIAESLLPVEAPKVSSSEIPPPAFSLRPSFGQRIIPPPEVRPELFRDRAPISQSATPNEPPPPEERRQMPKAESEQVKSKTKRGNLTDNLELKRWFEKQLEEGKHVCELLLTGNSPEDVSGKCPEFSKDVIGALSPARRQQFFKDAKERKMPQGELAQYIAEVKGYRGSTFLKFR